MYNLRAVTEEGGWKEIVKKGGKNNKEGKDKRWVMSIVLLNYLR